ncbi:pentapeptide repeat-containing protein [Synechococcus sp. MU1617]|uniref:pentapeptide repeat-containing protein n=1 Tax=Synechococcus sp. MU1617 TaxID=2508346 RepID=UPI001CF855E7|nr:pentapeptide repeat-containing protein [Synechococcus sp. MU1617]MCB4389113.1 pentapeptide repeat-containing protein [Synechococcus sp. MU1617]
MPAPLLLMLTVLLGAPLSARANDLIVLLGARSCPNCKLADADLVHADLRDADLNAADLQRANLSRARLDGADLRDADLRFSSLKGASLRGSDLRGARLDGTDLRQADLSGSRISPGALERSHWLGATGIGQGLRSPAALHNAGVDEAQAGRWPQAERLFGEAIQADPGQTMSWIARGLSRGQQGDEAKAAQDLLHAADLLEQQGSPEQSEQVRQAVRKLQTAESDAAKSGNGVGSALLGGALSTLNALAPLAMKTLMPGGLGL